jgi:hypothetical protein
MEKDKTERIKQLLSSYYGNAPGPGQPGGVPAGLQQQQSVEGPNQGMGAGRASASGAISLDSPAFNPDRHIAHMIQTYSIDRLMAEHKAMAKEIKNLDSDMQQLVYENYNKFIAATDTIRSMKSNVDSMETDIDQLRHNMGEHSCRVGSAQHHLYHALHSNTASHTASQSYTLVVSVRCMPL